MPEQLNPAALGPLYKACVQANRCLSGGPMTLKECAAQCREAISLAESAPDHGFFVSSDSPATTHLVPTERERAQENLQTAVEVDEARERMQRDTERLITLWRRHYHDKPLEDIREDIDAESAPAEQQTCMRCGRPVHVGWCPTEEPVDQRIISRAEAEDGCQVSVGGLVGDLQPLDIYQLAQRRALEWALQQIHYTDQPGHQRTYRVNVDVIERRLEELR